MLTVMKKMLDSTTKTKEQRQITEKEILASVITILNSNEKVRARYKSIIEKFEQQLAEAKLDKYRLGVIGVTSSGKSTMINAIMKKELLSMAVRPSSSQLVSCSKSKANQVKIYFEDKPPIIETGRNMSAIIKKYSDEKDNPENMLKVKQLELSTPGFLLPEEVLLIDSPGLDAYGFAGHEKLTMNSLLPTIDFCLFVTTCKTNSDEKMRSILDVIAEHKCPLIIVQNMIDSIKPSPDEKKTAKQVAADHRRRLEKIVDASAIKDKKSVKIVQISAKWALDSYTDKLKTQQQRQNLLVKSNFEGLIDAVEQVFSEIRPKIEHRHMLRIKEELQSIINNAKADIESTEEERQNIVFKYEGYNRKINNTYNKTYKELSKIINLLTKDKDTYCYRMEEFTERTISTIKSSVKKAENEIIQSTKKFHDEITKYCDDFNVDARRLRVLDSFGAAPGLKISTKYETEKKKKDGLGNKVSRFFGLIFRNSDWGYETITTVKYDHFQTRKNVEKYYNTILAVYGRACSNWENSAKTQIDLLIEQYHIQHNEFISRKEILLSEAETEKVIQQLERIVKKIPSEINPTKENEIEILNPCLAPTNHIEITKETYSLINLSKIIVKDINKKVFCYFTNWRAPQNVLVVGWDENSSYNFLIQNFGVNNFKLKPGKNNICEYLTCYIKPDSDFIKELKQDKCKNRFIFVVFNTLQYGAALGELDKSGILKNVRISDRLFYVVQDFEELITGDGVKEGFQNMQSINQNFNVNVPYSIMVNHTNPIYNMVLAEVQKNNCLTHADEVAVIHSIQECFGYFRNAEIDKIISDIMLSFSRR